MIGIIMNQNIDQIIFTPYINFGNISSQEQDETTEEVDSNNEDENINRNNEEVPQEQ